MSIFGFSVNKGEGEFLPRLNYNGKAGRMVRVDRVNTGAGWSSEEVDITNGFAAVFDLEFIEVGWICFDTGGPPDFRLVPIGGDVGPQPSPKHKNGVRVLVKLSAANANGAPIRELCSTAGVFLGPFETLVGDYRAARDQHPGQLPVVAMTGVVPVKGAHGTNYSPAFAIVKWVPRGDFVPAARGAAASAPVAAPTTGAPSTGARLAPPPPPATPVAVDSGLDLSSFG